MNRISARSRITVGLVALLVSVLMLAAAFGFVPSQREAIMQGRAKFCEAIAISSSALATRGDMEGLKATLDGFAARDRDILSAAVRQEDGKLIAIVGDHEKAWADEAAAASGDSKVYVPIKSGDKRWGTVEVRFRPLGRGGILGFLLRPAVQLVLFVASVSFVLYLLYLKKVLQHLDPSKAVPDRVRSALDTLAEGLLVLDDQGRIVLANLAFAAIAGRGAEDLLGKRASHLPWIDADDAAQKPWVQAIRDGQPQRNVMLRLRDSASQTRTFATNCSPIQGHDGKCRGVLVSLDDVTLLEAQKVELNKSKEAADAANQAKSEFLARMSHEIRTPMNAILGFADVLRRGFEESPAERQEYLETIHASGQHLMELINDILDLSKIESGRMQLELTSCSPHQLATDVLAVLRVRAQQKGISLIYEWDGPLPETIVTDPTRLRQILTNILGNAIKFTNQGSVRLVARFIPQQDHAKLGFDVIDTGIGIRPESLPNLFHAFSQADTSITRRFGGTGLGLSISRQLAGALGGRIAVESEFGKGSKFAITIDVGRLQNVRFIDEQPAAAASQNLDASAQALRLPPLRVLSVEDGESNQKLISLVLRRSGVAVVDQAANGHIGVEMALRGSYDVILMDMQMPLMDGYTATRTLRDRNVRVPIIALTAHAMKGEEDKCRAAGCSGYVPKPINIDLLLQVVAQSTTDAQFSPMETGTHAAPEPRDGATGPVEKSRINSTLPTDDPDFREVVVEFVDRLHQQLAEMRSAWEQHELSRVARLAHWLKGSGGSAGFNAFTSPAGHLEQLVKENRLTEIEAVIHELNEIASRIEMPKQLNEINPNARNGVAP